MMMTLESIARVAHEANRAYCESIGDLSQVAWADAPQWQKDSAAEGVWMALHSIKKPTEARELFESWKAFKVRSGWVYGPVKDGDKKTHPCIVEYDDLPEEQKKKDFLFAAIVNALGPVE